nr:MAG TPA: hypothetical protein [Caudoviricetes sp.]
MINMKNNKTSKEDKKKEAIEARNNINKIVDDMFENATPEQLSELLNAMVEIENEERQEIFEKTGISPLEQVDNEMRRKIYWAEKCQEIEEKKKAIAEKEKEERMIRDLLHPDKEPEGASSSDSDNNDNNNKGNDDKDDDSSDSSNNWKWIVMFAIFLLGIGGCFGGLIMKKSKDASETATSTYSQNKENNNNQTVEVKTSNPIEKDTSGSNDVDYLISKIDIYIDDPENVENIKAPKPNFKKLYKGEKKEEILEEKDLPNHKDPKFDGKLFVRYKGFLYKKTSPKHEPQEDTGEIDWYKELETFFTDKKEFYNTTFKKMGGEYCEAVKAIQLTDIGVVPYHHVAEKGPKEMTITAQVNMLDVDYEYRSRLDEIAMLRKMFYMYRYLLIDQSGHEEVINGVNPYDPKYRNIETYSGCQYKDTYWNQSGYRYNLRNFDPLYMNDFVKDIMRKYK